MKSKLLMLIIASFVIVGCTVDSKQRYQVAGASGNVFILDTHTGEIIMCDDKYSVFKEIEVENAKIVCTEKYKTH